MLTRVFLVLSLVSLSLFLYGALTALTNVEENLCRMTYMYDFPQYVRISFEENLQHPRYGLYAYSEGHLTEEIRMDVFYGAPVLFIPGNSGSYKQVRSLASVSLRKGLDNGYNQHLDYFSIDFNEEYSGLFGGVLDEQTAFAELCVEKILKLYRRIPSPPQSVIVIGHSMGGKIAQALLVSAKTKDLVNTIITMGTPVDSPVIAMDFHMHAFYKKIEDAFAQNRIPNEVTNRTNFCENINESPIAKIASDDSREGKSLNDKLFITIGGGSRDMIVHAGLTNSRYSDLHAIATSIPNVWVTTDHLCTMWCLQLVLVVNRFLYSVIKPQTSRTPGNVGQHFLDDKSERLAKAKYHFRKNRIYHKNAEVTLVDDFKDSGDWVENSKRIFSEKFKRGTNRTHTQMIRLVDSPHYKMLYAEVINLETDDWIFGCAALETSTTMRFCSKGTSITSQFTKKSPSLRHERNIIKINLHQIKKKYPQWTHILLRFLPSKEPFQFNIDIHNPSDREIVLQTPKWYSFSPVGVIEETLMGSSLYNIYIKGMDDVYQSVELHVKIKSCSLNQYHAIGKLCVPWLDGFERHHYFTETKRTPMYLYIPKAKPSGYNTTQNPIKVELNLDPNCRYVITAKNSLDVTMSRIVHQYSVWLPSHLVAIILLALKHQISLSPANEPFKCGTLHSALIKCSSFFIITASRVFVKMILWTQFLPIPDPYDLPILISIIIHGTALALLTLATGFVWAAISFSGNVAYKMIYKLIKMPIPTISGILVPIIQKFPITAGALMISIGMASCGAVALILACLVYFILLTKMYEDYLEEFIFKTAKEIAKKLFGKSRRDADETTEPEETNAPADDAVEEEVPQEDEETNNELVSSEETEENAEDVELNRLLKEAMDRQTKLLEDRDQELLIARVEYDAIHIGLSHLNFHLPLFFLLLILTILNIPSAITWAKNYSYLKILAPDPSIIPAIISIASLSVIWQLPSPRNISGYRIISSVLYISATLCILYCQHSVYRLNGVLASVFCIIALHQLFGFKNTWTAPIETPEQIEVREKIEKMKNLLNNS